MPIKRINEKKRIFNKIIVLLLVVLFFNIPLFNGNESIVDIFVSSYNSHKEFQHAVSDLLNNRYDEALNYFNSLNTKVGQDYRNYLKGLINAENEDYSVALDYLYNIRDFRNSNMVISYCEIMQKYGELNEISNLNKIEGLEKELKNIEVLTDFNEFIDIIKETKSLVYEQKINIKNTKEKEKYKSTLPYAGMSERFINDTIMGPYDKEERKHGWTMYYWYSPGGYRIILTVRVSDVIDLGYDYKHVVKLYNVVSEVKQSYIDSEWGNATVQLPYRIRERKYEYQKMYYPKGYGSTQLQISDTTTTKYNSNKSYNSNSKDYEEYDYYDDIEDFYENNYDDFESYEDAEDYYNEYYQE